MGSFFHLNKEVRELNFLRRLFSGHSQKINDFFAGAIKVYVLKGEEDARCVALAAAKGASKRQRRAMVALLVQMSANVAQSYPDKAVRKTIADRLLSLKAEIEVKGRPEEEEKRLAEINEEYRFCLSRVDPTIFKRKYPSLF